MLRPTQSALSPAQGRSGLAQARAATRSAWQLEEEGEKGVGRPLNSWIYASSIGKNISALDKYGVLKASSGNQSAKQTSLAYAFLI